MTSTLIPRAAAAEALKPVAHAETLGLVKPYRDDADLPGLTDFADSMLIARDAFMTSRRRKDGSTPFG